MRADHEAEEDYSPALRTNNICLAGFLDLLEAPFFFLMGLFQDANVYPVLVPPCILEAHSLFDFIGSHLERSFVPG